MIDKGKLCKTREEGKIDSGEKISPKTFITFSSHNDEKVMKKIKNNHFVIILRWKRMTQRWIKEER